MRRGLKGWCLCAVLAAGCYVGAYYDPYYYDSVYYDPYWYGYDGAVVYTWVDPFGVVHYVAALNGERAQPQRIDLEATAAGIAGAADNYFAPKGCAHATASGATVSYAFSNCTGPLGLQSLNGNLSVGLSEDGSGALVLTAKSDGLSVNGAPFEMDSVTTVTGTGDQRTAMVRTHSRDPGRDDAREADFTVAWQQGTGCIQVDGKDAQQHGKLTARDALEGYQRCTAQCPSAGQITVSDGDGKHFTGTFKGTPFFQVTAPNGDTRDYRLQCD